jgi:hypothetical protein
VRRKFTFYAYGSDIGDIIRQVRSLDAVFVSGRSESPEPRLLGASYSASVSGLLWRGW